jgi:Family of unknown function (DUF5681)
MSSGKNNGKKGNYDIGYGKPPKYTQYPKGKSGNLGGRPASNKAPANAELTQSELDEILRAELDRPVTITEGGKQKKLKLSQVVARAQISTAAKGSATAQRDVIRQMRELETRADERAQAQADQQKADREEEIASYKRMVNYKKIREAEWADAEAKGIDPDPLWPHPEDILLFPDTQRWRWRGPAGNSDLPLFNWYRAERDYLFAYAILDSRERKKPSRAWLDMYTILWVSYDVKLPQRWQLVGKMEAEFFNLHMLPMKKLEKLVDERKAESRFRMALAGIPDEWDKESYKLVNSIMKPLLKRQGYRSLRELEHAFETHGENMPRPKQKDQATAC